MNQWINALSILGFGVFIGFIAGASYVASKDKSVKELLDELEEIEYLENLSELQ